MYVCMMIDPQLTRYDTTLLQSSELAYKKLTHQVCVFFMEMVSV